MICRLQPYPSITKSPHEPSYSAFKEQMACSLLFLPTEATKQIIHYNPTFARLTLVAILFSKTLQAVMLVEDMTSKCSSSRDPHVVILGTFNVSWTIEQCLFPCSGLTCKISRWPTLDNSFVVVLGCFKVSWIIDLCLPSFPELASLDNRSAREFCYLWIWARSNVEKITLKIFTYLRYEVSCGSLDWYSPMTCPVTSNESLFTNKLWAPNS